MRTIQNLSSDAATSLVKRFCSALDEAGLSDKTVTGYEGDVVRFLSWVDEREGKATPIRRISSDVVAAYRHDLVHQRRLKPTSVNRRLQAVRRFFRWTTSEGLTKNNPSTSTKTVRVAKRLQPVGLSPRDVQAVLRASGQTRRQARRNYALIQLLLQTGLRTSEVVGLVVGDLELDQRSGKVTVRDGKGGKHRVVPLNAAVRRGLADYLSAREHVEPGQPLFLTERGSPMAARTVHATVSAIAARANLTAPVSAHTFRHTFALNYLRDYPGQLVELATLMGHESLDTTAIYTRPSAAVLAQRLEESGANVL